MHSVFDHLRIRLGLLTILSIVCLFPTSCRLVLHIFLKENGPIVRYDEGLKQLGCKVVRKRYRAAQQLLLGCKLDINCVSALDLQVVPGVGPSLSKKIVTHRIKRGVFGSMKALVRVKGIGVKMMRRFSEYADVFSPSCAQKKTNQSKQGR